MKPRLRSQPRKASQSTRIGHGPFHPSGAIGLFASLVYAAVCLWTYLRYGV